MQVIRHPKLASDIREVSSHYAEISDALVSAFWAELDLILASIERNPRSHHYDSCGLRRVNLRKFPYHLLYEVADHSIFLIVLRHDRRNPVHGLDRH